MEQRIRSINLIYQMMMNDALVCDGETYVKINTTPLEDNIKYGFTLDCQFEVSDTALHQSLLLQGICVR